MTDDTPSGTQVLIVAIRSRACALSQADVIETMRPQPIEAIACALSFVQGISIIRGVPTPVIDLGVLLGASNGDAGRFVSLRLGDRQVALSVISVMGVRELDALTIRKLPPLLEGASEDNIKAIGTLDKQLLIVLREGLHLPDAVWQAVAAREVTE